MKKPLRQLKLGLRHNAGQRWLDMHEK